MLNGKSIRILLVYGTPAGLRTAKIPTCTGHVVVAPRTSIQEALQRREVSTTGIYLLVGEEAGRPVASSTPPS